LQRNLTNLMRSMCRIVAYLVLASAVGVRAQSDTSPTVTQQLAAQSAVTSGAPISLDLRNFFGLPGVSDQVVRFSTTSGTINVEMLRQAAPLHVANFLNYVNSGTYANTFIHRAAPFSGPNAAIVQGGGYRFVSSNVIPVTKNAPVVLEYNVPNSRGTLAAARTSVLNSATSEWYFNVADNSTTLNQSNGGGYTVFGRIIGVGLNILDAISVLPRGSVTISSISLSDVPVRNLAVGFVASNLVVVTNITPVAIYPGQGSPSVLTFSAESSNPGAASVAIVGSTLTLTPGTTAGLATVTVRATDSNGSVASSGFAANIAVAAVAPLVVRSPTSQVVANGGSIAFTVLATGTSPTYQWRRDNQDLPGTNSPVLLLRGVTGADAGIYTVAVTNPAGSVVSAGATLTLAAGGTNSRLTNLSIRSFAGDGAQTLIAGFAIGGSANSSLVIRGVGPTLSVFGVPNLLADPKLDLFVNSNSLLSSSDNWSGNDGSAAGGFALPVGSKDAVLTSTLASGPYTAQVTGIGGGTGTALVEVYENAPVVAGNELVNLSARTQLVGSDVLIGGFTLTGGSSRTVLIRAIGPGLAPFNIQGTLTDPRLEIFRNADKVGENDDWAGSAVLRDAGAGVGAFVVADGGSKDAMLLVTLAPGNYTAQVRSGNGTSGVVLLEVYTF